MVKRQGSCVVWNRMDYHLYEAGAKAPMALGDVKMTSQVREKVSGTALRGSAAGRRSERAVVGSTAATSKGVHCSRLGKPKQREYRKKVSAGVTPGSQVGKEVRTAGLLSNGRGAASLRRDTGNVASSVNQEPAAGRLRNLELIGLVWWWSRDSVMLSNGTATSW